MDIVDKKTGNIRICLVIIFNHRYDENIVKLRTIYQERFHDIRFLIPFYEGNDADVIPVYECSYQFPGFLIQAYDKLIAGGGADFYLFVSDDLILNPCINENNVFDILKMRDRFVFITSLNPLNSEGIFKWPHARFSSVPFLKERTQWKGSIPDYKIALEKFEIFFGKKYSEEYDNSFFHAESLISQKEIDAFVQRNGNSVKIPYPMAYGYSDIFMLKAEALFPIARLCGVFSAMNMFAEISLPTAIVLSILKEQVVSLRDTGYYCKIEWDADRAFIEEEYHLDFEKLYKKWDGKNLFIHPVKLSKWRV